MIPDCRDCGGTGQPADGVIAGVCDRCGGTGVDPLLRPDPQSIDGEDGQELPGWLTSAHERCDSLSAVYDVLDPAGKRLEWPCGLTWHVWSPNPMPFDAQGERELHDEALADAERKYRTVPVSSLGAVSASGGVFATGGIVSTPTPSHWSGGDAPDDPAEGDRWYDTSSDRLYVWNGTEWLEVGAGAPVRSSLPTVTAPRGPITYPSGGATVASTNGNAGSIEMNMTLTDEGASWLKELWSKAKPQRGDLK